MENEIDTCASEKTGTQAISVLIYAMNFQTNYVKYINGLRIIMALRKTQSNGVMIS
jgi:hypothetical protein